MSVFGQWARFPLGTCGKCPQWKAGLSPFKPQTAQEGQWGAVASPGLTSHFSLQEWARLSSFVPRWAAALGRHTFEVAVPGPGGQKWQGTEGPDGHRWAPAASSASPRYRVLCAALSSLMSSPEPETRMTGGSTVFTQAIVGETSADARYLLFPTQALLSCLLPLTEGTACSYTQQLRQRLGVSSGGGVSCPDSLAPWSVPAPISVTVPNPRAIHLGSTGFELGSVYLKLSHLGQNEITKQELKCPHLAGDAANHQPWMRDVHEKFRVMQLETSLPVAMVPTG